jgi:ribosomal-protein-alanine N-acetyltransferase
VRILETERTYLREFAPGDAEALMGILGSTEAMAFSPVPLARDVSAAASLIAWHRESYRVRGFGAWAAIEKATGGFIGQAGLIAQEAGTELFYALVPGRWGRGLATEVACACRDHAFRRLGETRLISIIPPGHDRAISVARRVGMTEAGMLRLWNRENLLFEIRSEPNPLGSRRP